MVGYDEEVDDSELRVMNGSVNVYDSGVDDDEEMKRDFLKKNEGTIDHEAVLKVS